MTQPLTSPEYQPLLHTTLERLIAVAPTETGYPGSALDPVTLEHDDISRGYLRALTDLLGYIGAVIPDESGRGVRVPSIQAGFFLRMLLTLLDSGQPLIADWMHEGVAGVPAHPFNTGVDLLAALERRRLDIYNDAAPVREIQAAVGLIETRLPTGERAYLLHWDAAARRWQLVGGRFEGRDETLRVTMLRELAEELACPPLTEGIDVTLQEQGTPFAEERLSPTYGLLSQVVFQAYTVQFHTDLPPLNADLRWVTEAELLAGATADRQPIAAGPFLRIRERLCREE
jgi:8-oxo-dGTP pyrophosphatase MutT (NUDIX family)